MTISATQLRTRCLTAAIAVLALLGPLPGRGLAPNRALAVPPPSLLFDVPFKPGVSPEATVAELVLGMMACDEQRVLDVTVPHLDERVLWQSSGARASPVAVAQAALAMPNMPFHRFKVGDVIKLPSGKEFKLDERHVSESQLQITFPGNPLPFTVVKEDKVWKVDAGSLIAARQAALKASEAAAESAAKSDKSSWQPDAEAAKRLAAEVSFSSYKLRPPESYTQKEFSTPTGRTFLWDGPEQADGNRPRLLANVVSVPKEEADVSLERHLHRTIRQAIQSRRDSFQRTESERGELGGLTFARARWTAVSQPAPKVPVRIVSGIMYVAVDGQTALVLMCEEPTRDDGLRKTLEAAILTFRK